MITANASNFRKNLYNTLEQVAKYNQVATINTKDGDVVLISADDYKNLIDGIDGNKRLAFVLCFLSFFVSEML